MMRGCMWVLVPRVGWARSATDAECKHARVRDVLQLQLQIETGESEVETDDFARGIRAGLERSPEKLERNLARMLEESEVSTGR